jgi:CRISPR-associated protein Cmx8
MSARSATPSARKPPGSNGGKTEAGNVLKLDYSLAELPSAQHRAGLAGLVMMVGWLQRQQGAKGVCALPRLDDVGATLSIDREGLRSLLDETYAATKELQAKKQPWKNKAGELIPPVRIEEREVSDAKGKKKVEKLYYYEQVIPGAGLIRDLEPPSADGSTPWTKLWRDFLWSVLRGVPATREPFDARAEKRAAKDVDETWAQLQGSGDDAVDLPSTYYLGAQAKTAENVSFKDRARYQFLLHFWPYAAQLYVPQITRPKDGENEFVGYAVAIPDVAALETFCEELRVALDRRGTVMAAYRPREAIIDLPAESALDLAWRIRDQVTAREGARATQDLVLGFEVIHVDKEGNNIRIYASSRVEPERRMIDEYVLLRGLRLWAPLFRRQRLVNLLRGRPWHVGFDQLAETLSHKLTIGSPAFRHDARESFKLKRRETETRMSDPKKEQAPPSLEELVYELVQAYAWRKLESKYDLKLDEATRKDPAKQKELNEKKEKVAKEAFFAVRSRTGANFATYFASTICSVPQYLHGPRYEIIAHALRDPVELEHVRTLTLLALSAASWSPSAASTNQTGAAAG